MKKTLSMLLALVMVLAMIPLTAFAAEATVLVNVADQTVTDVAPYEYTWTVESAGTLTVEASGSPAWRYKIVYPDGSSTLDQKANQDWDLTATGTYTVQVYAYDNPGYTYTDGTVGLKLTFTPSEGGSEETPVEKAEYEVSSTKLALGDNTVSLLDTAVTTIYEFEPTEAATYTFTAPEGAIVGYWGAGSWFLQNPNSTTNTCEWTCSAVGQSAFVGVSGTEGSFNLNVAKTGEYVDTSIKYTQYENTHTPDEKYTACYTVGAVATETPVKGDDGFYYVGDKLAVVNFAASSISIAGMLGSGAAKYVEYNEDGTVKVAKDYTNALLAYTAVGNNYPMTDDLYEIIPNVVASKGWVESGYVTSWLDLVNTATVNHTAGEAVEEDGNTNTYCTVCGKLLSSEKIPATSVDIYYTGADVEVAAGKTVDCNLYFNGSMIMTVEGEGNFTVTYNDTAYAAVDGVVTIPGVSSSFWTPAVVQITNNSTADATYAVSFSLPVGSWSNPAALNTTDYNGNTATVAAGDQGYYFSWTAEGEGTLTLTVAYGVENWQLYVQNNTTYAQSETIYSPDDDVLEVEVAEGDEIVVVANTYNAADPYTVLAGEVVFDATYTAKQGTESNPYYIYDQDDTTAAVIDYAAVAPAGETTYYQGYGLPGTTLTFAAENVAVTVGGVALTAENGVYTYKIPASDNPRMPTVITITNNGTEDATYDLDFTYAIGTDVNPDLLPMGSDTVELAAGNSGYYYNWTAPCNGTLTVSVSGANWSYNINNTGDPESWADDVYGDYHYYYDDPVVATETWKVKTGDIVTVFVTTTDPDNWWSTPAGTVTVNASFKHNSVIHYDEVKPGCETTGNIEYWYCQKCEQVWQNEALTQLTNFKNVVVAAAGHDWDEGKVTKEATCTEKGEKTYTCEVCKATKTEEIAAKGHSYSSGKCLVCGAEDPDYKETTDNAQTGDESLIVMWTTVMILAAVAVVALVIKKRRMA